MMGMSLDRFISQWMIPEYPPKPVTDAGLMRVEQCFGFGFPSDYRGEVLRYGLVSPTIALLDAIVDGELDMADLSDLLDPDAMIESTEDWHTMGLPAEFVAFATDSGGSLFCFRTDGGDAIFYFDHDFGTVREIAPSFTDWILSFCRIASS
jgi:hypothetical protein